MKMIRKIITTIIAISSLVAGIAFIIERIEKLSEKDNNTHEPYGIYEKYVKRPLDAFLSTGALLVFSPVLVVTAMLVRIKLGSPVIFTQERPGKDGKIFKLYKFRTMTDERDENGELLPDDVRLTDFGKKLRATSIDELPELINIIKGDMAVVGPRPQLVRDMVFMTKEQRLRHMVLPGLTGLAQVSGRNAIGWDEKFQWDLKYIKKITLLNDVNIVWLTFKKVFVRSYITESNKEIDVTLDYGDWLLQNNIITIEEYRKKQKIAAKILDKYNVNK